MIDKLKAALKKFMTLSKEGVVAPIDLPVATLSTPEQHHFVPVYPPSDPGLPFLPVEKLLESQKEIIEKIRKAAALDNEAAKLIDPLIKNFAAFVHLLPASRQEQYPGNGGLFRMGLEVGFYSLRASHGVIFANEVAEIRVKTIPRWRIATFVAGLLCDTYRVITKMHVVDNHGNNWNPFVESIFDFLKQNKSSRYYIKWIDEKGDNQNINNLLIASVIPKELIAYLVATGPQVVAAMLETLSGQSVTPLGEAVARTRSNLMQRDLLSNPNFVGRPSLGSHLEAHLLDGMRSLLRSGKWHANAPAQPLWNSDDGLYLIIQTGWKDLYGWLMEKKFSGIPLDFDVIAQTLIKAGIIFNDKKGYVYTIVIPGQKKSGFEAVRLTSGIKAFGEEYKGFGRLETPLCLEVEEIKEGETNNDFEVIEADEGIKEESITEVKSIENKPTEVTTESPPVLENKKTKKTSIQVLEVNAPPSIDDLPDLFEDDVAGAPKLVNVSKNKKRVFNDVGFKKYDNRTDPKISLFLKELIAAYLEGNSEDRFAKKEDAFGFKAAEIDDAGLQRAHILTVMNRDSMLWTDGTGKKLIDVDGVQHIFMNKRFLHEVSKLE